MVVTRLVTGSIGANLESRPLRPEQITGGAPQTGVKDISQSEDGCLSCNLWDCTAGRFRWTYRSDEIIHVLEGTATITPVSPERGPSRTVKAGDVVYFPRGLVADWEVPEYVKKLAVHRSSEESLPRRVLGKLRRLTKGLTGV